MMRPRLPIVSSNPALPSSWPLTPATAHRDVIHGLVANQTRLHQEVLRAQRETESQPQDGVRPVGTNLRSSLRSATINMGEEHGILGVYSRGVPLQAVTMIKTPHPHLKQLGYVFRMAVDASIWALRDVTQGLHQEMLRTQLETEACHLHNA
ncbi:hypothetical protein QOT17_012261 [Balamuthia mandrillaris]